jgi:uncharacterized repeat protein (TIGR03803 family)
MISRSLHVLLAVAAAMVLAAAVQAQTFTTIYSFAGPLTQDGGAVASGVVLDPAGNVYGTTTVGGASNCGAVYQIDSTGHEQILHSFIECGHTTASPDGRLVLDHAGNLWGTAYGAGGAEDGNVFEIDASGTYHSFYEFKPSHDGRHPYAGLARDAAGNLYGTTLRGGSLNLGIVFVVDAAGHETVLHDFTGGSDGAVPFGTVIRDSAGNLYGTTSQGGAGFGTVYKIDSAGQFTMFYTFAGGAEGGRPFAGLIRDSAGNLYGVTSNFGDSSHFGVLFMLDPAANFTVLHNFDQGGGHNPVGGLARDSDGNLYGTAIGGGASNFGTVFIFSSTGKFRVLHEFNGSDGENPQGAVTLDSAGNLYGTTYFGGPGRWGTVFKISR